MEVQEQLVNEALAVLPELARALLMSKPHFHGQVQHLRVSGLLPRQEEQGLPGRVACPANERGDELQTPGMPWRRPPDIPVAQIKLITYLAVHGPKTMSEVAEGLEVTTPAITGLVDKLERRGLVERLRDSQDRRVVRVQLAPYARMIAERHLTEKRRQVRAVLATLTPDEQRMFVKTLKLLAEMLHPRQETRDASPPEAEFSAQES